MVYAVIFFLLTSLAFILINILSKNFTNFADIILCCVLFLTNLMNLLPWSGSRTNTIKSGVTTLTDMHIYTRTKKAYKYTFSEVHISYTCTVNAFSLMYTIFFF